MSSTHTILAAALPTLLLANAFGRTRVEMPATFLPRSVEAPDDGLASFWRAMLRLYVMLAVGLVLLVAAETHLGMFDGLTTWEAILKATGTGLSGEVAGPLL